MIRPFFAYAAALVATLTLSACSSDAAGSASGERIERTVQVGGLEREYIAHIPAGARDGGPLPAIFAFHPGLSSADRFERTTALHEAPGAQNFVVVYPNGYRRTWNAGDCCGKAYEENIDDLGFVRAIFDDLSQVVKLHPSRNFATGFSNGGNMTHEVACRISDRFAAIAVNGASHDFDRACPVSRPVSVMLIHGLEDPITPFGGGVSELPGGKYRQSVEHVLGFWLRHNRCGQPEPVTRLGGIGCDMYRGCAGGTEVVMCPVPGMGHVWPGDKPGPILRRMLGEPRPDLPGSAAIMDFFSSIR